MIPAAFDYVRPASVDEALRILASDGGAKVIAGGQSLLGLMKLRLAAPEKLVDIGRLAELHGIRYADDGSAEVGAATTYAEALAQTRLSWIREAIEGIGDVQVRNRGTIGGSIAHADPASDMPAIVLVLDYEMVLRSAGGTRTVAAPDFFLGPFQTAARPDEILVSLRRPPIPAGASGAYRRIEQPASGYSLVGVAAVVGRANGQLNHCRIGITGVGEVAYRATGVEEALLGSDGSPSAIAAAAANACRGITVNSDIHADREYRTAMAEVYTRRAIEAALAAAG